MDKRKEANLRVRIRITEALMGLMKEKKFAEITISELIRRAGVARSSYYRNYNSKEEVLEKLIEGVLEEFRISSGFDQSNYLSREMAEASFRCMKKYEKYILGLYDSGFAMRILEELNQFNEITVGTMPANSIERYRIYIFTGALLNTGLVWLKSGAKESVEDIAEIFWKYMSRNLTYI